MVIFSLFLGSIRGMMDSWIWSNGCNRPCLEPMIRRERMEILSDLSMLIQLLVPQSRKPKSRNGSKLLVQETGYWPSINSWEVTHRLMLTGERKSTKYSSRRLLLLFLFASRLASFVILDFILLLFRLLFFLWLLLAVWPQKDRISMNKSRARQKTIHIVEWTALRVLSSFEYAWKVYDTQDDHMSGSKITAIFSPSGSYPLQPWLVVQLVAWKKWTWQMLKHFRVYLFNGCLLLMSGLLVVPIGVLIMAATKACDTAAPNHAKSCPFQSTTKWIDLCSDVSHSKSIGSWKKSETFIELDDGKIYRKPLYLMVKNMVSCKFSHMLQDLMPHFLAQPMHHSPVTARADFFHGPLLNCELLQSNSENAMWSMTSCN